MAMRALPDLFRWLGRHCWREGVTALVFAWLGRRTTAWGAKVLAPGPANVPPAPRQRKVLVADQPLNVAVLQEVATIVADLARTCDRLLASGDDSRRRGFVWKLLNIIRNGIVETDAVVAEGVEVGTPADSLRGIVADSVCETRGALLRILDADEPRVEIVCDPRVELFAGETGDALRSAFRAASDRVGPHRRGMGWRE